MTIDTTQIRRPAWIIGILAFAFVFTVPDKGQAQSLSVGALASAARAIRSHQDRSQAQNAAKKGKGAQEEANPAAAGTDTSLQSLQSKSEKGSSRGQEHIESISQNHVAKFLDNIGNLTNSSIFDNGNVGIGTAVIPAGSSGLVLLSLGPDTNLMAETPAAAVNSFNLSQNAAYNSTIWKYIESAKASNYYQYLGTHNWRVSNATGTAGNPISWTTAMTIDNTGNVGIGTTSPDVVNNAYHGTKLTVDGGAALLGDVNAGGNVTGTSSYVGAFQFFNSSLGAADKRIAAILSRTDGATNSGNLEFYTWNAGSVVERLHITAAGNIGVGTSTPESQLHLYSSVTSQDKIITIGPSTLTNGLNFGLAGGSLGDKSYLLHARDTATSAATFRIMINDNTRMFFAANGNVGIGTTSPQYALDVAGSANVTGGNVTVAGNITATGNGTTTGVIMGANVVAKYQDIAEWVPASRAIPAGSVVVLDAEHSNHVLPSSRTYDTRVAGVVSASPGVILGEGGAGKVMVATTGRVRVKVDATNGPIRVGDLLVTSDKEGIAMRSQPIDIAGTPFHRPGTLIGKALEPLEKGVGEILVLLSLQ